MASPSFTTLSHTVAGKAQTGPTFDGAFHCCFPHFIRDHLGVFLIHYVVPAVAGKAQTGPTFSDALGSTFKMGYLTRQVRTMAKVYNVHKKSLRSRSTCGDALGSTFKMDYLTRQVQMMAKVYNVHKKGLRSRSTFGDALGSTFKMDYLTRQVRMTAKVYKVYKRRPSVKNCDCWPAHKKQKAISS